MRGAIRGIGPQGNMRCGMLASGLSRRATQARASFQEVPLRRGIRHARPRRGIGARSSHYGGRAPTRCGMLSGKQEPIMKHRGVDFDVEENPRLGGAGKSIQR
jgi:hypothetical protein